MKAMLFALFTLSYFMPMPHHQALAFWTYHEPGNHAQHLWLTTLARWPQNDPLFKTHWRQMGAWSEFPDGSKDPLVAHGIALFDKMDEKGRARVSFNAAVRHYGNYLQNPQNTEELKTAAECLAHAYHYFEDVGDFTQDPKARVAVSSELDILHKARTNQTDKYFEEIEKRRQMVNPDIDSIIRMLELVRKQRTYGSFQNNLLHIIACLEQVNVCFLAQVRGNSEGIFGSSQYSQNSLKGDIYELPVNTKVLPNFYDPKLKRIGTIWAKELNIPERDFKQGFPGVSDRIEWFAIQYSGRFGVSRPGFYVFRLLSDDGSRLSIDGRLTINNDGLHPPRSVSGSATLNEGGHEIGVEYFQGPRLHIALQLFVTPPGGTETVFRMP